MREDLITIIFWIVALGIIGLVTIIRSTKMPSTAVITNSETASNDAGPYRTQADLPKEDVVTDFKKVVAPKKKEKKKFTMPKLTKAKQVVLSIFGALLGPVTIGFIYDTNLLSTGLKWGLAVSVLALTGLLVGRAIHVASDGQAWSSY